MTDSDIHEQASRWVVKIHNAPAGAFEQRAFQAWLAADARHLSAYRHAERVWQSFAAAEREAADPQLVGARAKLREAQKYQQRSRAAGVRKWVALTVLLTALPIGWQWLNSSEYRTGKGQRLQVTLPDGSEIELNTDTRLRVNYAWQTRQVTLEQGEALFNVVHNPEKPFEVLAASGRIRDIGTRFNVSHWRDTTTVSVLEGEVEVSTVSSTLSERLLPSRQISYDTRGSLAAPVKFDTAAVTAWRQDLLVFNKTPLAEVLAQLSRYHHIELRLVDPSLREMKVSGDFPSKDLAAALNVIAAALPVKALQTAPGVIVLER